MVESIIHPENKEHLNDIALLKLDREVKFTAYVRPACLDFTGEIAENSAYTTGWGKTAYGKKHILSH